MSDVTFGVTNPVDELGLLLAQIGELQKRADQIKDGLRDECSLSGAKAVIGDQYVATFVEANRSTVDWKAIAKVLAIPADLIAEHTKTTAVYSIKVVSR